MKANGYYSSGEFADLAHVTIRTIRFYDKQNILKPSFVNARGARFYTDSDLVRLQQILLLKFLGFSLEDIKEMTIDDSDGAYLLSSLKLQKKLVCDRIEQMHLVEDAIDATVARLEKNQSIDWSQMLNLIHLTGMEKSLKSQYQSASNISARIRLHSAFSTNPYGWFPWLFDQCIPAEGNVRILDLGCGSGALWSENLTRLAAYPNLSITRSDISEGMIRDARRSLSKAEGQFTYEVFDCHSIPYEEASFDIVLANHVLFYCKDLPRVFAEVSRVLKPGGTFCCSAYSAAHMHEITDLVQEFDNRIVLSADRLYENFGLENGAGLLFEQFCDIKLLRYDDAIRIDQAEPLIEYILSCHGNQNQYLLDRYHDFRSFVERKVSNTFHITKDAGVFIASKRSS